MRSGQVAADDVSQVRVAGDLVRLVPVPQLVHKRARRHIPERIGGVRPN